MCLDSAVNLELRQLPSLLLDLVLNPHPSQQRTVLVADTVIILLRAVMLSVMHMAGQSAVQVVLHRRVLEDVNKLCSCFLDIWPG